VNKGEMKISQKTLIIAKKKSIFLTFCFSLPLLLGSYKQSTLHCPKKRKKKKKRKTR